MHEGDVNCNGLHSKWTGINAGEMKSSSWVNNTLKMRNRKTITSVPREFPVHGFQFPVSTNSLGRYFTLCI